MLYVRNLETAQLERAVDLTSEAEILILPAPN